MIDNYLSHPRPSSIDLDAASRGWFRKGVHGRSLGMTLTMMVTLLGYMLVLV